MKDHRIFLTVLVCIIIYAVVQFMPACEHDGEMAVSSDTTYLHVLKEHTAMLTKRYHEQVYVLDKRNDSLQSLIQKQKGKLLSYKTKSEVLEQQLKRSAITIDRKHVLPDSLSPVIDNYIDLKNTGDSICNQMIQSLELVVENKDKELLLCNNLNTGMRELSNEQQNHITALNDQLHLTNKQLKRKRLHNRILAAGVLVVSGIATAFLIAKPQN